MNSLLVNVRRRITYLEDLYRRYVDSALPLARPGLAEERRGLLTSPGALMQPPVFETQPRYATVDRPMEEIAERIGLSSDWAAFVTRGYLPSGRALYTHQVKALDAVVRRKKHMVVATGTGSGKTETFFLPILNALVEESARWTRQERSPGMRALLLYPLNALAEDQLIRLRKGLDGDAVHAWLDEHRAGHRFTFGQFTGHTPATGSHESQKKALAKREKELRNEARRLADATDHELRYHAPRMDDEPAERWNRTQMRAAAPDVFITNFSMLNVMMMRTADTALFEQTRQWLRADPRNVFHLVVDELHFYWGTAGSEVAYLLRLLLMRLGLTPDSRQFRFLASSASLTPDRALWSFLGGFIGLDLAPDNKDDETAFTERFEILTDPPPLSSTASPARRDPGPWRAFQRAMDAEPFNEDERNAAARTLSEETGTSLSSEEASCRLLARFLEKERLDNPDGRRELHTLTEAAHAWFGSEAEVDAAAGVFTARACARKDDGAAPAPVRVHAFFRNIPGLWVCVRPDCTEIPVGLRDTNRGIGKLYRGPQLLCPCGGRILDLLVCRHCGEIFLGGHRFPGDPSQSAFSITHGQPDFRRVPQQGLSLHPRYRDYAVFWPATYGRTPLHKPWNRNSVRREWSRADLDALAGRITICKGTPGNGFLYRVDTSEATLDKEGGLPEKCPCCDADGSHRGKSTIPPIQRHATSVLRVNQLLADALMRASTQEEPEGVPAMEREKGKPKLVVFSDSRQNAAKVAAGVELEHYRDLVREAVTARIKEEDDLRAIGKIYLEKGRRALDIHQLSLWDNRFPGELRSALIAVHTGEANDRERASVDDWRQSDRIPLRELAHGVGRSLLALGVNPGGPAPSRQRTTGTGASEGERWTDLLTESGDAFKSEDKLSAKGVDLRQSILTAIERECATTLFAHRRKSAEALRLGRVVLLEPVTSGHMVDLAPVLIRIMGELHRIQGSTWTYENWPVGFTSFCRECLTPADGDAVKTAFIKHNIVLSADNLALNPATLAFQPAHAGDPYWQCPRCSLVQLSGQPDHCWNCRAPFGPAKGRIGEGGDEEDYYSYLASPKARLFRLHCEELTGQTGHDDARYRQRLFQKIVLKTQDRLAFDGVDLLSVTTTMEAGVDIGGLETLMMANFPPQRFNYQQRAGRAGRRGAGLSTVLTVSRGASHDETFFADTARMLSGESARPYLDMRQREIPLRFLRAETLRRAFADKDDTRPDSIHGEFGAVADWPTRHRDRLCEWLRDHAAEVDAIARALLAGTALSGERTSMVRDFQAALPDTIDTVVRNHAAYAQPRLSERLAEAGHLPLFGFPTRLRALYTQRPGKPGDGDRLITRPQDIAISQFAPGAQTVRDKALLTAMGFVTFAFGEGSSYERDGHGAEQIFTECAECGVLFDGTSDDMTVCAVCGTGRLSRFEAWDPLGYTTEYHLANGEGRPDDYDGYYELASRSAPPRRIVSSGEYHPVDGANLDYQAASGSLYTLNDNNGRRFHMTRLSAERHRDTFWIDARVAEECGKSWKAHSDATLIKDVALFSRRHTDMLALRLARDPTHARLFGLGDDFVYGFAAVYSWGCLLRRAAARFLDIAVGELDMNVEVFSDGATPRLSVFLADRLDNGAGYCRYLARHIKEALLNPLLPGGRLYAHLRDTGHGRHCDSACYDCLRDYDNDGYHGILDWRLGLDMATLAQNANHLLDLREDAWRQPVALTREAVNPRRIILDWQEVDGVPAATRSGEPFCLLAHPLWAPNHPAIGSVATHWGVSKELAARKRITVFDALRRPGWCLNALEPAE